MLGCSGNLVIDKFARVLRTVSKVFEFDDGAFFHEIFDDLISKGAAFDD